MNKLKDIWQNNSKKIIYGGIGLITLILVIIIIVILINVFKRYSTSEVESIMVTAAESYLKDNPSLWPSASGDEETIYVSTLVEGKYMKELSKLVSSASDCTGTVTVINNNGAYRYIPTLTCGDYETTTLSETILSRETIATSGNGLYELNDYYTYRGEYVNNYVSFVNYSWRIVKFNDDMIYLILADTLNTSTTYVFDDRYNESINSYRGKNDFETSRVYSTLTDFYNDYFQNYHAYLKTMNACVHTRSEQDQDKTGAIECYTTLETPISLLSVYDYMNASIDSLCLTSASKNCSNYNYLATATNKWWLMNGTNENTYEVYSVSISGAINLESANTKRDLRIVIAIPSDVIYKDGIGTSSDPFTFYAY